MLDTLRHFGLFVLHNTLSVVNKTARQLGQMFPEKPPQQPIDIEDDLNEVEDDFYQVHDNVVGKGRIKEVERNRWGLPIIDEE